MTDVNKSSNEYFLTRAQFDAKRQAGTLEVGAVYHITDESYSIVSGTGSSGVWNTITINGVTNQIGIEIVGYGR